MRDYLPGWLQPYFTIEGRLGRSHFWLAYAVTLVAPFIIAVLVLPLMLAMELMDVEEGFAYFAISFIVLPAIAFVNVAAFCVAVRRLHDRDKSGWWLVLYFGLPLANILTGLGAESLSFPIVTLLVGLAFLAECGGLAGSPGVNSYGPPAGYAHVFDPSAAHAMVQDVARPAAPIAAPRPVTPRAVPMRAAAPAGGGFGRRGRA